MEAEGSRGAGAHAAALAEQPGGYGTEAPLDRYKERVRLFPAPRAAAMSDAAAIVLFAVVGLLSHHGGVGARGLARDALPLLGCWFAVALLVGLYTRAAPLRLAATWLAGITAGVAVRAAVLGHTDAGKEAAFLAVALAFTLIFTLTARLLTASVRPRSPRRTRPRHAPRSCR